MVLFNLVAAGADDAKEDNINYQAWLNFLKIIPKEERSEDTTNWINKYLGSYNGFDNPYNEDAVYFETEEDKLAFIIKFS